MQELRLVAVSEDGSYAVLAVPGRGGRFSLPVDDRLRTVARGQFSRLAQYEIEVENPLRPKEIQDRIRAGETADEIADAAGLPIERVRRFEGPVLAERAYRAQEAQRATVRSPGDSGPGPRLGDVVAERLAECGTSPDDAQWDSRKRADGNWQVQLMFLTGNRPQMAEWVFDPRRRHATPADDNAARLCLSGSDRPALARRRGHGHGHRHAHCPQARVAALACRGDPRGTGAPARSRRPGGIGWRGCVRSPGGAGRPEGCCHRRGSAGGHGEPGAGAPGAQGRGRPDQARVRPVLGRDHAGQFPAAGLTTASRRCRMLARLGRPARMRRAAAWPTRKHFVDKALYRCGQLRRATAGMAEPVAARA